MRRPIVVDVALALLATVLLALALTVPAGASTTPKARAYAVMVEVFGPKWAPCFLSLAGRETGYTYNPRATNWTDHHSDGSRGSFGLLQIGAVHRDRGESVDHFRLRMYDPRQNALRARRLFQGSGLRPWGGSCG